MLTIKFYIGSGGGSHPCSVSRWWNFYTFHWMQSHIFLYCEYFQGLPLPLVGMFPGPAGGGMFAASGLDPLLIKSNVKNILYVKSGSDCHPPKKIKINKKN